MNKLLGNIFPFFYAFFNHFQERNRWKRETGEIYVSFLKLYFQFVCHPLERNVPFLLLKWYSCSTLCREEIRTESCKDSAIRAENVEARDSDVVERGTNSSLKPESPSVVYLRSYSSRISQIIGLTPRWQ